MNGRWRPSPGSSSTSMNNVAGRRIVLGVCGGIAAYKVVELARELTQAGADVRVVMTQSAMKFVGPITFSTLTGNPVETEMFPEPAPRWIPHTFLARSADLIAVAPATANTIAKYANGIADDLLTSILLATRAPVVMAPAMHTEMWENEATVSNVEALAGRGVRFVDPEEGALAGPDVGVGRLAEISKISEAIDDELGRTQDLEGTKVVITAGGTREPIDAVRYIGNRSSGRMGFALAEESLRRGAKVVLISGPSHLAAPDGAEVISVTTAEQMRSSVIDAADDARIVVMAAAVADWRPAEATSGKLKKQEGAPELDLVPTQDILGELGQDKGDRILVGFAAETGELDEYAKEKLEGKNLDLIVANLVGVNDSGFEVDTNRAVMLDRKGNLERLPLMSKKQLARVIFDRISERFL